jgi:hypothetical protein
MEENKLIAEFMGLLHVDDDKYMDNLREMKSNGIFFEQGYMTSELMYDTDWNWLMDVVDKIESIEDGQYDVNILKNGTQIINYIAGGILIFDNVGEISYSEKIEHVYQAVIKFIKWYEQNSN